MATTTEIRAWLRDQGETVSDRGRLNPRMIAMYDQAHATPDDDAGWDAGDTTGDIADVEDLEPDVPMTPEQRPRTRKTARAEQRAKTPLVDRLLGTAKPKAPARKPRKAPPRMSVEKFTSRMYSNLGRMVAPLSRPMSNCLQAQAAFAGVVLEDMVRNTVVDKALQPLARAEDKLDKGFALFVPPLAVLAIEHSQTLPADEMMIRQAFLMPILRESLRIGLEVSATMGEKLEARVRENAKMDAEVDKLIRVIFGQPDVVVTEREPEMAGSAA
jgi:hypothetical protein